jgi:hypothetical protein
MVQIPCTRGYVISAAREPATPPFEVDTPTHASQPRCTFNKTAFKQLWIKGNV